MTRKKTGSLLTNFLGSGKTENPDNSLRYLVFNIALLAGGTLLVFYGIQVLLEGSILRAISDIFTGILCFATIIFLRTKLPLRIPGGITIGAFGLLCLLLVSSGEFNGIAALWVFTFPLIAIFVLGLQMGLVYSVMLFCGIVSFTVIPGLAVRSYSIYAASRYIGVYFLVTLLTVVYELSVIFRDRRVSQLNNELLLERDTITVMKDNLNIGLFLMNQDYVIQGAYSKTLEDILCTGEIEGNKLTVLLVSSLSAKERDTLEDYFRMILTRQFDAQMLSEINPIAEFNYIDNKSHKRKILKTGFSVVDQGLNDNYILGTMEDISAAKEMEWQLIEEAGKREEEMKSLFQVIQ
ncbi:MAG: hypothetical protein LBH07_08265, partial [Treponema sp.]|nr:hypothetical protein [Treponema sp.]